MYIFGILTCGNFVSHFRGNRWNQPRYGGYLWICRVLRWESPPFSNSALHSAPFSIRLRRSVSTPRIWWKNEIDRSHVCTRYYKVHQEMWVHLEFNNITFKSLAGQGDPVCKHRPIYPLTQNLSASSHKLLPWTLLLAPTATLKAHESTASKRVSILSTAERRNKGHQGETYTPQQTSPASPPPRKFTSDDSGAVVFAAGQYTWRYDRERCSRMYHTGVFVLGASGAVGCCMVTVSGSQTWLCGCEVGALPKGIRIKSKRFILFARQSGQNIMQSVEFCGQENLL